MAAFSPAWKPACCAEGLERRQLGMRRVAVQRRRRRRRTTRTRSVARQCARGPVTPKGAIDVITSARVERVRGGPSRGRAPPSRSDGRRGRADRRRRPGGRTRRGRAGCVEVERDAALVRVQVEEEAAALGVRHAARERTALRASDRRAGRLDLDDVGAEVGEQLGGVGGADAAADLEDAEAVERAGHGSRPESRAAPARRSTRGSSTAPSRTISSVCECSSTGQSRTTRQPSPVRSQQVHAALILGEADGRALARRGREEGVAGLLHGDEVHAARAPSRARATAAIAANRAASALRADAEGAEAHRPRVGDDAEAAARRTRRAPRGRGRCSRCATSPRRRPAGARRGRAARAACPRRSRPRCAGAGRPAASAPSAARSGVLLAVAGDSGWRAAGSRRTRHQPGGAGLGGGEGLRVDGPLVAQHVADALVHPRVEPAGQALGEAQHGERSVGVARHAQDEELAVRSRAAPARRRRTGDARDGGPLVGGQDGERIEAEGGADLAPGPRTAPARAVVAASRPAMAMVMDVESSSDLSWEAAGGALRAPPRDDGISHDRTAGASPGGARWPRPWDGSDLRQRCDRSL